MLDRKQKSRIIKLFSDGASIREIARKVGVSEYSVYRVIDSDVERDLEKNVKIADLMRKIKELPEPMEIASELDDIRRAVNKLFSIYLRSLYRLSSEKSKSERFLCIWCNGELEYVEEQRASGRIVPGYRCKRCRSTFSIR